MRALVWFRSDLRVRDNTALVRALGDATRGVVALFTICPRQWREHDWGDARVDFVLRSLHALATELEALQIPLKIVRTDRFDGVPRKLLRLARDLECDALYFNREYEINERRRDDATSSLLEQSGLQVRSFTDQVILEPGDVLTKQQTWFSVFTPFKRAWIERYRDTGGTSTHRKPRAQGQTGIASDPVPERVAGFAREQVREDLWPAGEQQAARRLKSFIARRVESYAEQRDLPAINGTSTLSPYLTAGVISPRQCFVAAQEANDGQVTERRGRSSGPAIWLSELIWREFYKHLLIGYPRLSMSRPFRAETDGIRWNGDGESYRAWCEGRTGYPIVDAAMRQLLQTGWMHNRLRMIVAMFLTKNLLVDWRLGERHFMNCLVDGDLAANNGGWQWSASTGTDAAPYFRVFNPIRQSERYDPQGEFIRRFVPELSSLSDRAIHDPARLAGESLASLDYPEPICDHASTRRRAIEAFRNLR